MLYPTPKHKAAPSHLAFSHDPHSRVRVFPWCHEGADMPFPWEDASRLSLSGSHTCSGRAVCALGRSLVHSGTFQTDVPLGAAAAVSWVVFASQSRTQLGSQGTGCLKNGGHRAWGLKETQHSCCSPPLCFLKNESPVLGLNSVSEMGCQEASEPHCCRSSLLSLCFICIIDCWNCSAGQVGPRRCAGVGWED